MPIAHHPYLVRIDTNEQLAIPVVSRTLAPYDPTTGCINNAVYEYLSTWFRAWEKETRLNASVKVRCAFRILCHYVSGLQHIGGLSYIFPEAGIDGRFQIPYLTLEGLREVALPLFAEHPTLNACHMALHLSEYRIGTIGTRTCGPFYVDLDDDERDLPDRDPGDTYSDSEDDERNDDETSAEGDSETTGASSDDSGDEKKSEEQEKVDDTECIYVHNYKLDMRLHTGIFFAITMQYGSDMLMKLPHAYRRHDNPSGLFSRMVTPSHEDHMCAPRTHVASKRTIEDDCSDDDYDDDETASVAATPPAEYNFSSFTVLSQNSIALCIQ